MLPMRRWWPRVNRATLGADTLAGLTSAIIVLPQGVAFATLAGMPPQYGLYTAMVPAVVAALFGSSWHLVSGPINVTAIYIYASMSPLATPGSASYVDLVLTLTLLTGIFQLVMGLARMGALVNFISHTVVVSFTAGAAVLIFTAQIGNFFGIAIGHGESFAKAISHFVSSIGNINPYVTAVGVATIASGYASKRWLPRLPYMVVAMVIGSLIAAGLNVFFGPELTKIAMVSHLPAALPPLSVPDLSPNMLKNTLPAALALTILALTSAMSIARVIAVRSGQHIDANQEFIGQGLSNIAGAFFSAYASCGSFNRSGANYEAGARTPLAAILSALFLVAILAVVGGLVRHLPLAVMAGILFMVASGLIDVRQLRTILRASRREAVVMLVTVLACLFADLEFAIYAGVLLSLLIYLTRTSRPLVLDVKPDPAPDSYHFSADSGLPDCPQLKMLRINGSLFFGAVEHVQRSLERIDETNPQQKHVLLVASGINFIDVAAAEMLVNEARRLRRMGGGMYFYRLKDEARQLLVRGGYFDDIGEDNVFPVKSRPVSKIYFKLDSEICRHCRVRIFRECWVTLPNGEPVTAEMTSQNR
jgi:SulP family sulfate permease